VRTIDPAPAIARQAHRLLSEGCMFNHQRTQGVMRIFSSGDPQSLAQLLLPLSGEEAPVTRVNWEDQTLLRFDRA